jgi:uncharacterized membrane protein
MFMAGESKNEKILWGILSYLGILCLLPLLLKKDDSFIQFHAKQGLIMLIVGAIIWVVSIPMALLMIIPAIGPIINILWMIILFIIGIPLFILWVIAIIKVIQLETWKMPVIGGFAEKINL